MAILITGDQRSPVITLRNAHLIAALQALEEVFELGFFDRRWLEVPPLLRTIRLHPEFRK